MTNSTPSSLIWGSAPVVEPDLLTDILTTASDLAFVLSSAGQIESILVNGKPEDRERLSHWAGQSMIELLTSESIPKFNRAIKAVQRNGRYARRVELNHTDGKDWQYPVRYSFHPAEPTGSVLMIGHDLRSVAETQDQLVQAQIAIEQVYEKRREYDVRFRILLANTREALVFLSIDGEIRHANAAAASLLGTTVDSLHGNAFSNWFRSSRDFDLIENLQSAANSELETEVTETPLRTSEAVIVSPRIFRVAGERLLFCRLAPASGNQPQPDRLKEHLHSLFLRSTDAIVICTPKGIIKDVNESFLDLAGISGPHNLRSRSLADFLGRGQIDLNVLIEHTVKLGRMQVYSTRLSSEFGPHCPVEISSVYLNDQDKPAIGLVFRDVGRVEAIRGVGQPASPIGVPNQNVVDLVGSSTLKEIVTDAIDAIERICIGAAVEMTGNNRAAAAQMLGLSRQSVYVKLRKYGLLERGN